MVYLYMILPVRFWVVKVVVRYIGSLDDNKHDNLMDHALYNINGMVS